MIRNVIPGLRPVTWDDINRQNEFVNSVVSALNALGENLDYDYVCAVSGCAFRTSFSVKGFNHGNYHVIHTPDIIGHTFKMLGYGAVLHTGGGFETDRRLVIDSVDMGVPVVTVEGVVNCSDACVIAGYDESGRVLLGYNPFMYVKDDHDEPHDETGYFRKSGWHADSAANGKDFRIIIIGEKHTKPNAKTIFNETMALVTRLIGEDSLYRGQHNGLSAHRAFAGALTDYAWDDNFEPYLNVMCNYKQYLDRRYAAKFFRENNRNDLAGAYGEITALVNKLAQIIPQDFSAADKFSDKAGLKPYCDVLNKICDLEEQALKMILSNGD